MLGTGGGAVLRDANRAARRGAARSSTCTPSPATLYERVRHSRHRPMLRAADPAARIAELYAQRDPLYRAVADHVIASDRDEVMRFARVGTLRGRRRGRAMTARAQPRAVDGAIPRERLDVALGARSYPIHIGTGAARARRRC